MHVSAVARATTIALVLAVALAAGPVQASHDPDAAAQKRGVWEQFKNFAGKPIIFSMNKERLVRNRVKDRVEAFKAAHGGKQGNPPAKKKGWFNGFGRGNPSAKNVNPPPGSHSRAGSQGSFFTPADEQPSPQMARQYIDKLKNFFHRKSRTAGSVNPPPSDSNSMSQDPLFSTGGQTPPPGNPHTGPQGPPSSIGRQTPPQVLHRGSDPPPNTPAPFAGAPVPRAPPTPPTPIVPPKPRVRFANAAPEKPAGSLADQLQAQKDRLKKPRNRGSNANVKQENSGNPLVRQIIKAMEHRRKALLGNLSNSGSGVSWN